MAGVWSFVHVSDPTTQHTAWENKPKWHRAFTIIQKFTIQCNLDRDFDFVCFLEAELSRIVVTIALPAIIFSYLYFARKAVRFYHELSAGSHLPCHEDNCAVWEIFGKLSQDKRNLIALYLPELCLPIDCWPDSYKYVHSLLY